MVKKLDVFDNRNRFRNVRKSTGVGGIHPLPPITIGLITTLKRFFKKKIYKKLHIMSTKKGWEGVL